MFAIFKTAFQHIFGLRPTGSREEPTTNKQRLTMVSVLALTALWTSCGVPGVPLPPSLELAKPVSDLRAVRKGDKVYLAWTVPIRTTDRQNIRHFGNTAVCRSLDPALTTCGTLVGEVAVQPLPPTAQNATSSIQATFVDTLPKPLESQDPTGQVTYAISVMNTSRRSAGFSNRVQVPSAPTLPPPADFKAVLGPEGVTLRWSPVAENVINGISHFYRAYRREEGKTNETQIGSAQLAASFLSDPNFEWEKTYNYRLTIVTSISSGGQTVQIEGDDTPIAQVVTHDVFPPTVPSGLQAVASGNGQTSFVDLIWSPDTEADLAGYNIYRHEEGSAPVKVNQQLVTTPAYRDSSVATGKTYYYSVSAVDLRSNESEKSEEANEAVP